MNNKPNTTAKPHGALPVTRRRMLQRLATAASSAVAAGALSFRCRKAQAGGSGAIVVEQLPSGVEIWQVTTDRVPHSNIYCEVPYCSKDGRRFVYQRRNVRSEPNRTELVTVELETWKQEVLDTALNLSGCAITPDGYFYYQKRQDDKLLIMRADVATGSKEAVYEIDGELTIRSLGTVSSDHRFYAVGTKTEPGWSMFDILLVDLEKGEQRILDRDPFILNPHPQFDPGSHRLLIQHNRGGRYSADGKLERLVGPEGATLYLLSVPDGKRTTLQVGKPYTTPCTGHEAWIGTTGEVLLTVAAGGRYAPEKGNLLGVRAGGPARVVARGYRFNHVGVSRCGRLFSADDWQGEFKIVIGSTTSGKTVEVCPSKTKPERSQSTHPHPYLTPDLRWVIFNSNRSGFPQIHAARVPESMVAELLA